MNSEKNYTKGRFWMKKIALFVLLAPLFILAFGYIVMTLWNFTLPALFGVSTITFWQAIALLLLSKILFGGFHGGKGHKYQHSRGHDWKLRWKNMSEEERAKYRERWQHWCNTGKNEEKAEEPGKATQ